MSINVFPVAVSSAGPSAYSITAAAANTLYGANLNLSPAVYTITCLTSTIARVGFYSDEATLISEVATTSGSVAVNLASAVTKIRAWTDTGTNVQITITQTANAITNSISSTLDTITTTGTYTGTSTSGYAFVGVVGAGGGGGSGPIGGNTYGGGAGGGGGIRNGVVALTGNVTATIGSPGNGTNTNLSAGNSGGATSFGSLTANGGAGGAAGSGNIGGAGGAGGTPSGFAGGSGGQNQGATGGAAPTVNWTFLATNPIGSPGNVVFYEQSANPGTGYGAGGSASLGGSSGTKNGAAGRPGIVYVLRY